MERMLVSVEEALCSACGLCQDRAPDNIEIPPGEPVAQVIRQPKDEEQTEACVEASEYCPTGGLRVDAIAAG